ncbi:PXMP2/4 family protein 3-like protein [Drosera capensis]
MEATIFAARNLRRRRPSNGILAGAFNSAGIILSATLFSRHSRARPFSSFASSLLGKKQFTGKQRIKAFISSRSSFSTSRESASISSTSGSKNGLLGWYLRMLETRPLVTKGISSSVIYTLSDVTSQTLPKSDMFTTFKKILAGQAIYGPCINSVFFSYNAGLRGESRDEIIGRLKRDLLPTIRNGLMYWPVCDFLTFKFVPVHLQPLVNSSFAYVWTIYLTYVASLKKIDAN